MALRRDGGCLGAAVAVAMAALDLFSVRYFDSWMLAVPVGLGVAGAPSRPWRSGCPAAWSPGAWTGAAASKTA